jgi:hypothetical protein
MRAVGTVLVMHFASGDRWIEGTDEAHVGAAATQQVLVVIIEQIQGAVLDRVDLAGLQVFDFPIARDTVDRLDMVLVPDVGLGTRLDDGFVERETGRIVIQDERRLTQLPFSAWTSRSLPMISSSVRTIMPRYLPSWRSVSAPASYRWPCR